MIQRRRQKQKAPRGDISDNTSPMQIRKVRGKDREMSGGNNMYPVPEGVGGGKRKTDKKEKKKRLRAKEELEKRGKCRQRLNVLSNPGTKKKRSERSAIICDKVVSLREGCRQGTRTRNEGWW